MTLLPSNIFGIRGHPGNAYDVAEICATPGCGKASVHAHHCWPRSYLRGQPYDWVKLPDGTVIGNRVGLCLDHHNQVTGEIGGYRAKIRWQDGLLWWEDRVQVGDETRPEVHSWISRGPLVHQPPGVAPHDHEQLADGDVCPTCGHHKKRSDRATPKPGKARPTKEWVVTVPDDAEIGADVLDDWVEDFAIVLGMDEYSSRLKRYHVLSFVLGWAGINRAQLIADVAEAAERRVSGKR